MAFNSNAMDWVNFGLKIRNKMPIINGNNKKNKGTPHCNQSAKLNPAADAAMALGGLPISVTMPPKFAEYAKPNKTKTYILGFSSALCRDSNPKVIGSINAIVAVLLIHIESKAVVKNNNKMATNGRPLASDNIFKANN